ncbi:MAG: DNRLRE domain-containing protein [Planctomycetota bacterium]
MRLLVAVLFAPTLAAQLITLPPIADATTDASQPAVALGNAPELDFGKAFTYTPTFQTWLTRGHVRFDLTGLIGTGMVPTRATFFWYQRQANAAGCLDVSLHNLLAPWSEATVTWQTQPAFDPIEISRTCVGDSFAPGWKEFDVTSLAQRWLAGTVPNLGFVIRDPAESTAGAARPGLGHAREYANPALRPYLELDFAFPVGSGCTTHATTPALGIGGGAAIMGSPLVLSTTNLLPGSLAVIVFGLSDTFWQGLPLPLSLASIGHPNCSLNVELGVAVAIGIVPGATAALTITVPTSPPFDGLPLFAQTFAFTPSTDLEASNGLGFRVWL